MFRWFTTFLHSQSQPVRTDDEVLTDTIAQLQTCRKQLVLLIEEARTARQLLDVTEITLQRAHKDAKRELYGEEHADELLQELPPLEPATFTAERRQR